jgi:hypothetical protein
MENLEKIGTLVVSVLIGVVFGSSLSVFKRFLSGNMRIHNSENLDRSILESEIRKINEAIDSQSEKIEEIRNSVEVIHNTLGSVKITSDLLQKYCVPSKEDREFRDRVEIDNEHFDRIGGEIPKRDTESR